MSGPAAPPPADPRVLAILTTVTYGAAVIALWGFTSLALDVDAITQRDAGPLLGPAMVLAACVVTFVSVRRVLGRATPTGSAAIAAASAYVVVLAVGAIGYSVSRADLTWLVIFPGGYALSPFVLGAAMLSGITVLTAWAVTRPR
jgi:uncharacterized membrane protein